MHTRRVQPLVWSRLHSQYTWAAVTGPGGLLNFLKNMKLEGGCMGRYLWEWKWKFGGGTVVFHCINCEIFKGNLRP